MIIFEPLDIQLKSNNRGLHNATFADNSRHFGAPRERPGFPEFQGRFRDDTMPKQTKFVFLRLSWPKLSC